MVFLIVGPATNTVTLSFIWAKMGKKSFYLYIASIIFVAVSLGAVLNAVMSFYPQALNYIEPGGEYVPYGTRVFFGVFLGILMLFSLCRRKACPVLPSYDMVIEVEDIHCDHCRLTLDTQLKTVEGVSSVLVDVKGKKIKVRGGASREAVTAKIRESGYHPKEDVT
jgi:copper chaperone CopZ